MVFQLYTGGSGSGKSHRLFLDVIRDAMAHPREQYVILVPEQFSMQTQQELVRLHPAHGILNIDVLSFGRLAWRVLEELGGARVPVLTETGKNLLLRRVAGLCADQLGVLRAKVRRPGTVSQVKSVLSEFAQYAVTPGDVDQMIGLCSGQEQLKAKLADIRILYGAFRDFCRDRFITAEEVLSLLALSAPSSRIIRESHFVLDGFTGFTPQQRGVLEQIFALSRSVRAAVTIPADEPFAGGGDHELFSLSRKTIRILTTIAKDAGCEIREPVRCGGPYPRFADGSRIAQLEKRIFRYGKKEAPALSPETAEQIRISCAASPAMEVREAAVQILRLTREEGIRCREIAVITGNPEVYGREIRRIFTQCRIPFFLDSTRKLELSPALELIRGAFDLLETNFSRESVFRFLRTGLADVTREQADSLENYCLARGIRGRKRWETPFEDEEQEKSRAVFMAAAGPWAEAAAGRSRPLRDWAGALYDLLVRVRMQEKLAAMKAGFEAQGDAELVSEYTQIYPVLIGILDEAVELIGDEEMTRGEFADILEAGIAEARIGMIPPGLDRVHVGDVERTRLAPIKVLFFLGVNDGWIPAPASGAGLVSDMEREFLKSAGVQLSPTVRESSAIGRFYLYLLLTKPSRELRLSWCQSGEDGRRMQPSYLIGTIRKLFPDIVVSGAGEEESPARKVVSAGMGFAPLARGLRRIREQEASREDAAFTRELLRFYLRRPEYRQRALKVLDAAFACGEGEELTGSTALLLYGPDPAGSVTRLEKFAACPFAHFAAYGLRLRERQEFAVSPADVGSVFHDALEQFSRRVSADKVYTWQTLPDEVRDRWMEEACDRALRAGGREMFFDSERSAYTGVRIRRILLRTAWALQKQLQAGAFVPDGYEVAFDDGSGTGSIRLSLPGASMRIAGRIDRIDVCAEGDDIFVKVLDYKSGGTALDATLLYHGLQLQLPVYLGEALALEEKLHPGLRALPAGILYYHVQDPFVSAARGEPADQILRALRPGGLISSDPRAIDLLESSRGTGASLVLPAEWKSGGALGGRSHAASPGALKDLAAFADRRMHEFAGRIFAGERAARPYRTKKNDACKWCPYGPVCGFDRKIPGMEQREPDEMKLPELMERIEKTMEREKED